MRPTDLGHVTTEFGVPGPHWSAGYHTGRDYRAAEGTPVKATWRGQVRTVGDAPKSYGLYVVVESLPPGVSGVAVRHYYCHLSRVDVKDESWVNPGQRVGLSGDTGNTTSPHLHYEERVGGFGYADHRRPELDGVPWRVLDMSQIAESFRVEPGLPSSHEDYKLHPDNTKVVQAALRHEGLWSSGVLSGHVSGALVSGYKVWEQEQGWPPSGVPSYEGMSRLGRRWGFTVTP